MIFVYWFIIAGLVWNCIYFSNKLRYQRGVIADLRVKIIDLTFERDFAKVEYQDLKAKIVEKAAPIHRAVPKVYTGAQLRVLNDRLNAQAGIQERPNSEILKEQVG